MRPPIEQPMTTGRSSSSASAERDDHLGVAGRGEPILLVLPSLRRQRLAVPRHVERQHAKVARDRLVEHQVAELPAVGAGGVQAHQRNARAPLPRNRRGADAPLQARASCSGRRSARSLAGISCASLARRRGDASRSLKYCRLAISGCRSPSMRAAPRLVSASRSCQPGSGTGCHNLRQASVVALISKARGAHQDRPAVEAGDPAACHRQVIGH